MTCTPEDHIQSEIQLHRFAFEDGRKAGVLEGHRMGFDEGYLNGFSEGSRSSKAWESGNAEGWVNEYLERIGDELTEYWDRRAA